MKNKKLLVCNIYKHKNKNIGVFSKAVRIGQHCPMCYYLWNHGLQVDIGIMEEEVFCGKQNG